MSRRSILGTAISLGVVMVLVWGCQDDGSYAFQRDARRYMDVGDRRSQHDEQWWQDHKDQILLEGKASCVWLEEQPELDEGEYQDEGLLTQQYLDESDITTTLNNTAVRKNVVELAWADLCIDTRNSRTSLPWGAVDD